MKRETYAELLSDIPLGKRLNNAIYLHAQALESCSDAVRDFVEKIRNHAGVGSEYNVVKFFLFELRVSFLSYPDFFETPHPQLRSSISVNLTTGRSTKHNYDHSSNPPILHRKESLLNNSSTFLKEFTALTEQEEAEGLYTNSKKIGFMKNWESLLAAKGLAYSGHKLIRVQTQAEFRIERIPEVQRHRTAITRYKFSRPIQSLLEHGLLDGDMTLLDYGCGQGDDVKGLQEMGYAVSAWDPVFFPDGVKNPADVVNLGFVLNVIEDPIERMEVLHEAYDLSRKLLVVSTLIATSATVAIGRPYKDGILTSRNTFQKYFRQEELERYLEDVLDTAPVAVGPGIFYMFRSPIDQQQFLSNRSKRAVNWMEISRRLLPPREERPRAPRSDLYERNKELLDAYWARMLELGRPPLREEFERYDELREKVGTANKAKNLYATHFGDKTLARAFESRRNDLQVYLALSNFKKRVPFKNLPDGLRTDMKTFFGGYQSALEDSQALLFSAGNPENIAQLCDETAFGYLDEQALYVHRSLFGELHPVLRIYVGCAEVLYGDLKDIDIIKIHKRSGKVSLLKYDDFEAKPLPELQERVKVNLRRQTIEVFDHQSSEDHQLLYIKERYVADDHPTKANWEAFTRRLQGFGLDLETGYGPTKRELLAFFESNGVTMNLDQQEDSEDINELE